MDNFHHSAAAAATAAESVIFAALSTLTPTQLSILSLTLSTTFRRHSRRLATLLSSQTLFTTTLNHLLSLPLPSKSLLLARHLLSTLRLLVPFLHHQYHHYSASSVTTVITSLRDLDAALLLLLFCELRHHSPWLLEHEKMHCWRKNVMVYFEDVMLTLSGIEASNEEVIRDFVDVVVTCLRFAGRSNKKEVAAAAEVVVRLPGVEVAPGNSSECAVCREEMREGREVCMLPCGHMFHWWCVLPWFRTRNTCPCCRFRLPTDDVYGEIERLWEVLARVGRDAIVGEQHS
ncbi:hypothetical protein Droror1_Dr00014355 [Drosera rotundifolia]